MTLFKKTATELQSLLHNREVSVKELTEESLARIAKMDGKVQAFLSTNGEAGTCKSGRIGQPAIGRTRTTIRFTNRIKR